MNEAKSGGTLLTLLTYYDIDFFFSNIIYSSHLPPC